MSGCRPAPHHLDHKIDAATPQGVRWALLRPMKLAAALSAFALLVAPASAHALVKGDWGAYAALSKNFRTPLPTAYVHASDCPDHSTSDTCANPSTGEAWIPPGRLDRFTLAHELGHLFDGQYLTDADRAWLQLVMRAPDGDWWKPAGASEWFADYYADCALRQRHSSQEGYISRPPTRRLGRVCFAISVLPLVRG